MRLSTGLKNSKHGYKIYKGLLILRYVGMTVMIKTEWTYFVRLPFIGALFLEYRRRSRGSPLITVDKEKHEFLFCFGNLCGVFAPSWKK